MKEPSRSKENCVVDESFGEHMWAKSAVVIYKACWCDVKVEYILRVMQKWAKDNGVIPF